MNKLLLTNFWFIFFALLLVVCSSFYKLSPLKPFADRPFNSPAFDSIQRKFRIYNGNFIRPDLYTWTTKEQVALLRKDKKLLYKSQSEKYAKSNYDLLLDEQKAKGNTIAAFLAQDNFSKKRFAFPHPWATVRGYPGENYGDQLIKISFKENAVFGSFITTDTDTLFRFYSSKGKMLDADFVLLHPERLAVVYFVHSRKMIKKERVSRGTYRSRSRFRKKVSRELPYREYVICNEAIISQWSYGTQAIKNKLKEDIDYLQQLKETILSKNKDNNCAYFYSESNYLSEAAAEYWRDPQRAGGCPDYISTLALVNDYYDQNEKQLNITIKTLNKAISAQSDSLIVNN